MSGRINDKEMADMYATVDLSKKKKKMKASSIAASEAVASADTYAVLDRKSKSKETKISTNSEWAAAEYSELDPSKINESSKHTYVSSNSLPVAQVGNGQKAHFQKFKLLYALTVAVCLISLIFLILFIILFLKVVSLESTNPTATSSLPDIQLLIAHAIHSENVSSIISQLFTEQLEAIQKRIDSLNSSKILISYIYSNVFGVTPGYPSLISSCAAILEQNSSSTSGYYFVRFPSGQLKSVYCDMRRTCGNITGGWMRVTMLDLQNCPRELKQEIFNSNITTCVVRENGGGCTSILYNSRDIPYSRVCGRIRAYKIGTPDGFRGIHSVLGRINGNYLDGISITVNTPTKRAHVWSLVAGPSCFDNRPNFVGKDLVCDQSPNCDKKALCDTLLWKSQQYERNVSSWMKEFLFPLVSDIEVRVCRDQKRSDEDLAITTLELYVQ